MLASLTLPERADPDERIVDPAPAPEPVLVPPLSVDSMRAASIIEALLLPKGQLEHEARALIRQTTDRVRFFLDEDNVCREFYPEECAELRAVLAPEPTSEPQAVEPIRNWRDRVFPWRWVLVRQARTIKVQDAQIADGDRRLDELEVQAASLAAYLAAVYGVQT